MARPDPSILPRLLRYDQETGQMFWRERSDVGRDWNTRYAGKEAFLHIDRKGYRRGSLLGGTFAAHRVAFAIMMGRWPLDQVDHIDRNPSNNAWANLREASNTENARNQGIRKSNTSGAKGVSWHRHTGKWQARITIDSQIQHLGVFTCRTAAAVAYALASQRRHGDFGCVK